MNQLIVGLWGPAGVGKDSIARELGWPTASFAKALKDSCRPKFEAQGLNLDVREDKVKGRHILVSEGAGQRKKNPFHWIERIDRMAGHSRYAITDVRYLNEIQYVLFQGGVVYEIARNGFGPANDEETRSFAEIAAFLAKLGVRLPVIQNTTPLLAAQAIKDNLRTRAARYYDGGFIR